VGQDISGGGCEHIEEMGVGWGFDHGQLYGPIEWKGEKGLFCA
jgi:hypothetical protein